MGGAQKFPFAKALANAIKSGVEDGFAMTGRSLPCHVVAVSGQIVTVQFDMLPDGIQYPQVTIPVATFPYIRYPIQKGDRGVTVAADVSLRGITGLGVGIADRAITMSLTPLFFVPLANKEWSEEDPNKMVLYGPDGAVIRTENGGCTIDISGDAITLSVGKQTLELSSSGLKHNGVNIGSTHKHDVEGVEPGSATVTSKVPK